MALLDELVAAVGTDADTAVTPVGWGTRGGGVEGVHTVSAPTGIDWIQADEMTVCCAAGTPVDELAAALAEVGQRCVLPPGGTVGGALANGISGVRQLGDGPLRDALLQARYVSAAGEVVTAGGPTVKNVSGFDLCRLLVGSCGTLGVLGEVVLRTRPLPRFSSWFVRSAPDPDQLLSTVHRPTAMVWDGLSVRVLLEGHPRDVELTARANDLTPCAAPEVPTAGHRLLRPADLVDVCAGLPPGRFLAELGVGVVHLDDVGLLGPPVPPPAAVLRLQERIKRAFDPSGRLSPGRSVS